MASDVMLLPEPDSPTMPSVSPRADLEGQPVHGDRAAALGLVDHGEVLHHQQRVGSVPAAHSCLPCGSKASRSPSPMKLTQSTVSRMNSPGK